jgi:hypothetical protein
MDRLSALNRARNMTDEEIERALDTMAGGDMAHLEWVDLFDAMIRVREERREEQRARDEDLRDRMMVDEARVHQVED